MPSNAEIHEIAQEAARAAVTEMLLALGIDANDPKAVLAAQRDFAHLRSWRQATDTMKTMTIRTAVGVLVSGALGMLYLAFKSH